MQNHIQALVNAFVQRPEIGDRHANHALPGFFGVDAFEQVTAQQQMRKDDPGGKQIGTLICDLKVRLFGAHVVRFARHHFALVIHEKSARLGNSEIRQFHVTFERDHDIFETDIAMDDAQWFAVFVGLGMGVSQAAHNAANNEHRQFLRQNTAAVRQLPGKLLEVGAANQFHRHEINAASFAQVVGLDDIGMNQVGDEFGFANEIIDELFLVGVILANDLDGNAFDEAAGAQLLGFVHDAHTAFINLANDFVAELVLNREQSHAQMLAQCTRKSSVGESTHCFPLEREFAKGILTPMATQSSEPILEINLPGIKKTRSGKVRDIFDLGDRLLFVATDRISAFDCIMPNGIPRKGEVLTQISYFWFAQTEGFQPNHLISRAGDPLPANLQAQAKQLQGRSMIVKKAKPLAIECVVRGYLAGSGWKEYRERQTVCGMKLPAGLQESSELPQPIFTPATKAETGHDENISFEEAARIVGPEIAERARAASLKIYNFARDYARRRGIIIADTKFEFGLFENALILIDEVLTPDSSRFWPADQYQPGKGQPSFDKQFVRDYLETLDWNKQPPAPPLPAEVVARTEAKYLDAFQRLTGKAL